MKKLLLMLIAAVAALSMSAAPVNQATAMQKAKNYLTNKLYAGKIMAPAALQPVLLKAEPGIVKLDQPVYYIYNTSTTFLVVAGDDRAEEILMIGDRPLKDINNLPPGLQDVLYQYKQEIMFLQENPDLKVDPIPSPRNTPSLRATSYGPLLTAVWDQEAPFYNLCKFTYNSKSYQCLTGCPATSASMVLYYWKYPTTQVAAMSSYTGTLELSYYNSVSFTYPALSATTFDWNNMIDDYTNGYTTAQGNAVATLMRYVGQAEKMMYGTSSAGGSGIYTTDTQNVVDMFTLFGYDASTCRVVLKQNLNTGSTIYSDSQWATLIQNEMAAGRPIVYMAVSSNGGGHAFNVDGYDSSSNKYHVNFGWSGDGNSWYSINSFSYSGYTFNQYPQAVIGIQPPTSTTPVLSVNPTSLSFTGCLTGQTYTKTFTVSGSDLRGDVSISSNSGTFAVSPTTLTAAQAQSGATITVTYKPTSTGTQNGTITISSSAAESKTVSVTGTATTVPSITVNPTSMNLTANVGSSVTQSFSVQGLNLTGAVYLSCQGNYFSIDKTNITKTAASAGATVTVTYKPTAYGTHTGTVTLTSSGAEAVTVQLNGQANLLKYAPVMSPAIEQYINRTAFRADWTDQTPEDNVTSYTLEVSTKPTAPPVQLIGSVAGTDFSGSATGYYSITLPAPWGGANVRGGLNSIIYFRNNYQGSSSPGYITYTIPEGYENTTFTMKITTGNTNDATGNLTVATPQTAAVGHTFAKNETFGWVVTASSGEKITITTTDTDYSPDIAKIEVYTGDATAATLMASETGDENSRLITGITGKFYTVENLAAEGTFLYRVKALYIDGTESDWSNIEQVTLFGPEYQLGDVNHDGYVNITDATDLINYLLNDEGEIFLDQADVNEDSEVNVSDAIALINLILNTV